MPAPQDIPGNPEQLADLAALQQAAAEGTTLPAAEAAPVADPADTWAMLPAMVGSMLSMAMPELKAVYTPEACQAWGAAMVPVAEEYGWNAEDVLGPKMALAMATAPFVIGTAFAIKARKIAAAPSQDKAAPGALVEHPGNGQKTIVFGSPDAAPAAE